MEQKNSDIPFIFKRSFIGAFWGVVFVPLFVAYFLFKSAPTETLIAHNFDLENPSVISGLVFYGVIAVIYSFIISHIKYTERIIRLMSDREGSKMASTQSLLLSKKIFKDSVRFRVALFFKYYWHISLIYIFTFYFSVGTLYQFAFSDKMSISQAGITLAIAGSIALIGGIYVHFILAAKTRFVWFVYMSHFGELILNKELFNEVRKLNNVDSGDDKVAMAGYLKRDMSADISSVVTDSAIASVVPKSLGADITRGYARGMIVDIAEYSKMELNFSQYRDAYSKLYGKNPELSQKLLGLL